MTFNTKKSGEAIDQQSDGIRQNERKSTKRMPCNIMNVRYLRLQRGRAKPRQQNLQLYPPTVRGNHLLRFRNEPLSTRKRKVERHRNVLPTSTICNLSKLSSLWNVRTLWYGV